MENNNELQLSTNRYTISVISEIKTLLDSSRKSVATQVNQELLSTYLENCHGHIMGNY